MPIDSQLPADPPARIQPASAPSFDAQYALGQTARARASLDRARALGGDSAGIRAVPARADSAAAPAADEPPAAGHAWSASLASSWHAPASGPGWRDQAASVRRYLSGGSLGFEALRAQRFGRQDHAWALDAYAGLWRRAYVNLRYQHAAAGRLFPAHAGRIEVWQGFGQAWEASLSGDVLGFDTRVAIVGLSLARYVGNYYVQLRGQRIAAGGVHSHGARLLGRWYYRGDADDYLELSLNGGRSDDPLSLVGGQARSGGGALAWNVYVDPRWGVRLAASLARAQAGGPATGRERGVDFALMRRW